MVTGISLRPFFILIQPNYITLKTPQAKVPVSNRTMLRLLQAEIGVFVFLKVLLGRLRRNSLQRIIAKSAAMMAWGDNAAFLTDNTIIVYLSTKGTVFTGPLYFLSKQHCNFPLFFAIIIIHG